MSAGARQTIREAFKVFTPYEGLDLSMLNDPMFYTANPKGCENCEHKGYKGRIGVYEVMELSEDLKEGITSEKPSYELQKIALQDGMISLEQDGIIKAAQGLTSLEEVYKLVKN